jgi:hypothetical protein
VLKLRVLTGCSELQCLIFYLHYGINCYVAAVPYFACEDVVLGYGCVGVFVLVSVVEHLFRGC